uniref:Uncharacterized protein n=1 Tax=Meloidogyne enterolobii TaxID=390850 RepID=A0A6V7TUN6_MELEN|nr:unnamed protein product [Meloidogyne enterolobii]
MALRKEDSRGRRRSRSRDRRVSVDNRRCSVGNRRMATAGNHRRTAQGRSASRVRTAGGQQSIVRGVRTQRRVAASRAAVEPLDEERQRSSTNSLIKEQNAAQRWFQVVKQEDVRGVRQQYAIDLQQYRRPGGKYEVFNRVESEGLGLNRYEDVQLLDHSRVVLRRAGGIDYIHASHVHGGPFPMICTQGPLDRTIGHFWTMVAENNCAVIVQLCQYVEDGRRKCADYFPQGRSTKFGNVTVEQVSQTQESPSNPHVKRTLFNVALRADKPIEVAHFRFDGWPDHDVPDNPASFRQFRLAILRQAIEKKCTVLIHCSAGVGRTGTYAAIEIAIRNLIQNDHLIQMSTVYRAVRNQRERAIQTDLQYLFLHRAVIDAAVVAGKLEQATVEPFLAEYEKVVKRKRREAAEQYDKHKAEHDAKKN